MNADDFARLCRTEKDSMVDAFSTCRRRLSSVKRIDSLGLNDSQLATMRQILDGALTDAYFNLLVALDGGASLNGVQQPYDLRDGGRIDHSPLLITYESAASLMAVTQQPPDSRPAVNERDTFINAVRDCVALPECVRDSASSATGIEISSFDASYLEFLGQQVELNARGDEWSQRLTSRRSALAQWCDIPLIGGRIAVGNDDYTVKVDPKTQAIVYWEHYADCR